MTFHQRQSLLTVNFHFTFFKFIVMIRQYVMRFTLTINVIVTIIKKKHLLSDEIFMETFQDGEFLMKCRKYQLNTPQSRRASYLRFKSFPIIFFLNLTPA